MIVDSYAHVGLKKYRPIEHLVEQMEQAGVDRAVLVQPLGDLDNSYLRSILEQYPGRFKTVGLADVNSYDVQSELRLLLETWGFGGVRATAEALTDSKLASALAALDGVLVLHLPDGIGQHLDRLTALAEHFPRLRVFVPHLGWPQANGQETSKWKEAVTALARYPGFAMGISALHHFSARAFPHEDTWPWMELAVEAFGPERCMCGSDFPLLLETESYSQLFSFFGDGNPPFPFETRKLILGEAAARFWRIE